MNKVINIDLFCLRHLKICIFTFIMLLVFQLFPQKSQRNEAIADSLKIIIETLDSSQRADALLRLSNHYLRSHTEDTVQHELRLKALSLAQDIDDTLLMIRSHKAMIYEFFRRGQLEEVKQHNDKIIVLSRNYGIEEVSEIYMVAYEFKSRYFNGLEEFDSAQYYAQKSIDIAEKLNPCKYVSNRYLSLSKVFLKAGDRDAELQAYLKGYNIAKTCNENESTAHYVSFSKKLGYLHLTLGNYYEALHFFKEADSIYSYHLNDILRKKYHALQASNIARVYQHWGKLDSAMKYRLLAVERFLDYGFKERSINVPNQYCYIGMIYREWGDLEQAEYYLSRSLDIRKEIGDSLGVGMSLDEKARLAMIRGKYLKAIGYLNESLIWKSCVLDGRIDAFRYAQKVESQSDTYLILGQVFSDWGKFDDAMQYLDTALMLARRVQYTRGESIIEYNRGLAFQKAGMPDSAFKHFQHALGIAESTLNKPLIAKASAGLGLMMMEQEQLGRARLELESALNIYLEEGFSHELPEIYLNLGKVYMLRDDQGKALDVFQKAYDDADRMGMIPVQAEAAKELSELHESGGKITLSNHYLKKYILLHDSIFNLETHRQLAEMQAQHESQQQQLQIMQLQQSNELNSLRADRNQYITISLGGIVIIILLFAVLFIRQIRIRNEQRVLINQQQLFRSQMNPHFIFNSLTNIQHFIFSKDSLSAGKYLAIFAKLMRSILNNSRKEIISLKDEISTITQYLELQCLRFEDKLEFEIDVDENLDREFIEIPPMLAQPFIENAIEHGIRNMEKRGKIDVRILKVENYLVYEVEDNGIGRKKASELKSQKPKGHESMAVNLTRSRLQNLWGRNNPGVVFEIIDLIDDHGEASGTLVRFKVPASW